jgi:nitrogen fixation protein NifQ
MDKSVSLEFSGVSRQMAEEAVCAPATSTWTAITHILEKCLGERDRNGGRLADLVGVSGTRLAILLMMHIPAHPLLAPEDYVAGEECEEQGWVRDLLLRSVSTEFEVSPWLAHMIARRAMEGNHLWEDLGLENREQLNELMRAHFEPLAEANSGRMRWKRFFYRALCEEDGYSHCTSPTCADCPDVEQCFEPDSAEAIMARNKRSKP